MAISWQLKDLQSNLPIAATQGKQKIYVAIIDRWPLITGAGIPIAQIS